MGSVEIIFAERGAVDASCEGRSFIVESRHSVRGAFEVWGVGLRREVVPVCIGGVAAKPVHCEAHGTWSLLQDGEARRCELSVQVESEDAARALQESSSCNRHSFLMTPSGRL